MFKLIEKHGTGIDRFMVIFAIILTTLTLVGVSDLTYAARAVYTGEKTTGMTKQCYYSYAGSKYTVTIKAYEVCPSGMDV